MEYDTDKLILTDVDGVLLAWEDHFHAYMHSQGHERAYEGVTYWQETHYPGLSEDAARQAVFNFNTSAWMMAIPAFRDARSGVARLVEHGYRFHAITAMGTDPNAKKLRWINLEQTFGKDVFVELTTTDSYDPDAKREALSKYRDSGLPWIEDSTKNATLGHELGLRSILMEHEHNREFEAKHIERVSSWANIYGLLVGSD